MSMSQDVGRYTSSIQLLAWRALLDACMFGNLIQGYLYGSGGQVLFPAGKKPIIRATIAHILSESLKGRARYPHRPKPLALVSSSLEPEIPMHPIYIPHPGCHHFPDPAPGIEQEHDQQLIPAFGPGYGAGRRQGQSTHEAARVEGGGSPTAGIEKPIRK